MFRCPAPVGRASQAPEEVLLSKIERSEKVFATEEEAQEFATKWRRDMWAYDGSTTVYQQDGQWIVYMRYRDSCD